MDEETEPDCGGPAYVATRRLLQAAVITALRHNESALLSFGLSISVTHAITKCNTV